LCHAPFASPIADFYTLKISNLHDAKSLPSRFFEDYRMGDRLIFRYDNANDPAAKQLPTFPHHKHVATGLLAAEKPSFEQVLQEIVSQINFS
jgi:hypothetical protein